MQSSAFFDEAQKPDLLVVLMVSFEDKFNPTFQFAYELNSYFTDAKPAVFYLNNDFILQPSIGFSVFRQVTFTLTSIQKEHFEKRFASFYPNS